MMVRSPSGPTHAGEPAAPALLPAFAAIAKMLEAVGVAFCLFDEQDRTRLWNAAFLTFFPEHAGHVHPGEDYRDNLYRFYRCRLDATEMLHIHRYVAAGIARHRSQSRPFTFTHRGRALQASSLPIPGAGRARIWLELPQDQANAHLPCAPDLFANLADGAVVLDRAGGILAANQEFLTLYDLASEAQAIGLTFSELLARLWDVSPASCPSLDDARFAGAPFEVELPGARWRRIIERRMPDGTAYMSHTDITVLKRQQRELAEATNRAREGEERFRILAENSGDIIVSLGPDARLQFASPAIARVLGWPPEALDRLELGSLVHPEDRMRVARAIEHGASDLGRDSQTDDQAGVLTCRLRRREGGWTWMEANIRPVRSPAAAVRTICTFRDITPRIAAEAALRDANDRLAALVVTDPLTGIANRRRFEEVLLAHGPGAAPAPFSLLMIDVDHFKQINDAFGHLAGDGCLVMVARTIARLAGPLGHVARIGGEEFAAILPGAPAAATALAERIACAIRADRSGPYNESRPVTVSIGVASATAGAPSSGMDAIVLAADTALYRAKRNGRDQVDTA